MNKTVTSKRNLHKVTTLKALNILLIFCVLMVGMSVGQQVSQANAQVGSLQVTPTRIVFEGRKRSATVTVINTGSKAATYRISFKNMRMNETGNYKDIEKPKPGEYFSEPYIVYSPRQVILKPGQAQSVRLLLRKKKDMAEAEYRSHLLFRALPSEDAGQDIEALTGGKGEIRVKLIPVFGVTIPIIIRHGRLSAEASLANISLTKSNESDPRDILLFDIHRKGSKSIFGDIKVKFRPRGGDEKVVGLIRGIAIYASNKVRKVSLPMKHPEGLEIKNGILYLTLSEPPDEGGKLLGEAQLKIN